MKILNIGIPTYNRTKYASRLLDSINGIESEDFEITLSSNGVDKILREKCKGIKNCNYHEFEKNMGPGANFEYLFLNSKSKFTMLISDEDLITCKESFLKFLDWLKLQNEKSRFILVNIDGRSDRPILDLYSSVGLSLKDIVYTGIPVSSYITGFCISNKVGSDLIKSSFKFEGRSKAYGHLNLLLRELSNDRTLKATPFSGQNFIKEGDSAHEGGDAYPDGKRGLLNQEIYGLDARVDQLVFMINESRILKLGLLEKLTFKLIMIHQHLPHIRLIDSDSASKKARDRADIFQAFKKNIDFSTKLSKTMQSFIILILYFRGDYLLKNLIGLIKKIYSIGRS